MSQSDVLKIKERLGIKDVIESYIKVEKAGKNYKARCPFHNEKTPSFHISPERENYYCFGCGAKGDIFTFVQEFEGTDFLGALKTLAEKAGVTLEKRSSSENSKMKRIYDLLEEVNDFYRSNLSKNQAVKDYLKNRGLSEETVSEWKLGYAKDDWRTLFDYLIQKKYTEGEINSAGLIKKGEKGNYYDRFRSRIMFPIFDSSGRTVAFTGRIFEEGNVENKETAKYINSPETELFKKSQILYGFNFAKSSIRKNDFSILVEGQMDALMAHQAGYRNTIASSGTALTEEQLKNISRISEKMVIAYDSDSAGFKASERAWQLALGLGMDIKIASLKKGQDPADVIKEDKEIWKKSIKDSKHIIEILVENIKERGLDDRKVGKAVAEEIIPYLVMIKSRIDQNYFIRIISDGFSIPDQVIREEIEIYEKKEQHGEDKGIRETRNDVGDKEKGKDLFYAEKRILGLLELVKKGKLKSKQNLEEIEKKISSVLSEDYLEQSRKQFENSKDEILITIEEFYEDGESVEKEIKELLKNIQIKYLNNKLEKLKTLQRKGEEKDQDPISMEIIKISRQIEEIKSDDS